MRVTRYKKGQFGINRTPESSSAGGKATATSKRYVQRPSETFDWDKALKLFRKTLREVYGK